MTRHYESEFEGRIVHYAVEYADIEGEYPVWTPESNESAPISTAEAIRIARNAFEENLKPEHGLGLQEIKIVKYPMAEKWYYVVTLIGIESPIEEFTSHDGKKFPNLTMKLIEVPVYFNGMVPVVNFKPLKIHIQSGDGNSE